MTTLLLTAFADGFRAGIGAALLVLVTTLAVTAGVVFFRRMGGV